MRRPLIAGNWKMYKTPDETHAFFEAFKPMIYSSGWPDGVVCDIVICPPFPNLHAAVKETRGTNIAVGAQNLYWGTEGAVTGEVSGHMLRAVGCSYVVVAHSERRQYFGESEPDVLRKTHAALEFGLTPIVCLGERLEERESNRTEQVIAEQFEGGIGPLTTEQFAKIVIAYEPVWAIGTGRTATPQVAADVHRFIRRKAAERFGESLAAAVRILYGGSVKPENVRNLMTEEEIDGALVGGASLDPASFAAIVKYR